MTKTAQQEAAPGLDRFPGRVVFQPLLDAFPFRVFFPMLIVLDCGCAYLRVDMIWAPVSLLVAIFCSSIFRWHFVPPCLCLDGDGFDINPDGAGRRVRWRDVQTLEARWPGCRLSAVSVTANGTKAWIPPIAGLPPQVLIALMMSWREKALATYHQGNVFIG